MNISIVSNVWPLLPQVLDQQNQEDPQHLKDPHHQELQLQAMTAAPAHVSDVAGGALDHLGYRQKTKSQVLQESLGNKNLQMNFIPE